MANNSMITQELLDQLLVNYEKPEDMLGEEGLFKRMHPILTALSVLVEQRRCDLKDVLKIG